MLTVSTLLDESWRRRYQQISKLNIRSSIYDITNKCNIRCKGCFFFSSGEDKKYSDQKDVGEWDAFVDREMERGVNLAILIGGEPTIFPARMEAFYKRMPTYCATNGLIKVDRDRFPDMMVGISLWGDEEDEVALRGKNCFGRSSQLYAGDPNVYYLYTLTPQSLDKVPLMTRKIRDCGLKVHFQLLSNDDHVEGYDWTPEILKAARDGMDEMLDLYPETVVSCRYYHRVMCDNEMLGRPWGWNECPSVSADHDTRDPKPKHLISFIRWGADLKTTHRCCTSDTRDCNDCRDGAAKMSWVMVNKRAHMRSAEDLRNWIEVYEMFAKLYRFIHW